MFEMFREHHRWQGLLGVRTVGDFNEKVEEGQGSDLIRVSEALQEKRIAKIADDIAQRTNVKVVLIAGPSSSGKTTFVYSVANKWYSPRTTIARQLFCR